MAGTEVVDMITQMDPTVAGAIGASGLGLAGVIALSKNTVKGGALAGAAKTATKSTTKIDVSIPYDAAARLAYDEFVASGKEGTDYETFKTAYENLAVAQVTLKKAERELNALN